MNDQCPKQTDKKEREPHVLLLITVPCHDGIDTSGSLAYEDSIATESEKETTPQNPGSPRRHLRWPILVKKK